MCCEWTHFYCGFHSRVSLLQGLSSKVEVQDDILAACTKCSAVLRIAYCKESKSAKFIVTQESGHDITLSAFEPVLSRIVDGISGQDQLLSAPPKVFRFNDWNVVFSVQDM